MAVTAQSNLLSIVAAVYNAESTFADTLRCVFASNIPVPFEVVVVDDASTDGTVEVCKSFDLKLIELESNAGPAKARNIAVREARGDIIFFIDSDVQFGPDLIRDVLAHMDDGPDVAGVGSLSRQESLNPCFYSNYFAMQEWDYLATAINRDPINHGIGICTRCGTIRRTIFEEAGGFDEHYTHPSIEDYDLSIRIIPKFRFVWDTALLNDHFFPETLGQIFKRYHRNAREHVELLQRRQYKGVGVFQNDSRARLCMGMSGLSLLFALVYGPAILPAVALFLAGLVVKRSLFLLFLRRKGVLFCLGAILVYVLTSLPIATGVASGFWRRIVAS